MSGFMAIKPNILDLRLPRVYSHDPVTKYARIWQNVTSLGVSPELHS